jgi:hypothetical protein
MNIDTFSTLYEDLWRKVYSFAFKSLANREKAIVATEEAFFQLWLRKDYIGTANDAIDILLTTIKNERLKPKENEFMYMEPPPGKLFKHVLPYGAN